MSGPLARTLLFPVELCVASGCCALLMFVLLQILKAPSFLSQNAEQQTQDNRDRISEDRRLDIEELMCCLKVGVWCLCQASWRSSKGLLVFVSDCRSGFENSLANWNRAAMASSHHWESWVMWLISSNPNRKISWPTVRATVAIRLHARIMSNWTAVRKTEIWMLKWFVNDSVTH